VIILWVGIALTLGLFLTGSPIFVALGIGSAILCLCAFGLPPSTVADMLVQGISSFTMLALPLFVYMGDLFLEGGSARPLIDVIKSLVGRIPGGMGIATVVIAAFISAICGSSTAGIAMVAMIMIPEMASLKYEKGFAGAIVSASGSMANLIPPSLFFILYGALCELNIATLFAAGMLPGIICALVLALVTFIVARRKDYPLPPLMTRKEKRQVFIRAIPALIMPVIVLGSIYGGIATPTEAAAVSVVYSMFLGFFVYRKLNLKTLWKATSRSAITIAAVLLMVAGGVVLGRMFVIAGFPEAVKSFVMAAGLSPLAFLLLAGVVIIILGTFIECVLMLYVSVPLFYSTVLALGISPIHFGVLVVLGIMVGQSTPPMAEAIYVASSAGNVPSVDITKNILPFVIGLAITFYIIIIFPELSLIVPRLMGMVLP
jgi:C4-dicarboxylate transporter DctM subunit